MEDEITKQHQHYENACKLCLEPVIKQVARFTAANDRAGLMFLAVAFQHLMARAIDRLPDEDIDCAKFN